MATATFSSKVYAALKHAYYVKRQYRRGLLAQLMDIAALYRANPTCNISDYYKYQVYAAPRGAALYTELLGTGALEAFSRSLNPRNAVTPAWDKMLFTMLCDAYSLPAPEILAVYKPAGPLPGFIETKLSNLVQLKAFLLQQQGPVFVKPVKGHQGKGAFYISAVDVERQLLIDKSGNAISFDQFFAKTIGLSDSHRYRPDAGVLLQRPVVQHPAITEFTQTDTPSGLRILVLNTGSGPYIHRAIWKIIAPGNISDNFSKGAHGNMVVQVNPDSGKLSAAVNGYWPTTRLHHQHPVSGRNFGDFSIPLWDQIKAEILRASTVINDMGAMHWDIIVAETGPVLLELNDVGSTEFLQLHGQGLLDPQLKTALRQVAVVRKGSAFARLLTS
ncbi:hypothetical protein WG68_02840 [Arsukibacterium ikkense]|uniref:Alpha-L-glutamate ligase-related protein ATP-grasp domain-containing protein n=1 Tax=Arsukibacterium ikkense TaxID=336831 RepID=A0A0M2V7R2_9GAMM|nr:sugar-transfer associated ATP-grasp domain-containing protein [Arsukibacterium ikkense]KKO46892.1 hypothetical protein WG68_02840 [Arsukibacterium ikkense]